MKEPVLIDIDVKWEYMEQYKLFDILDKKIELCSKLFSTKVESIILRKSQCNHVHLYLLAEVKEKEDVIRLKYCIGEDHKRLNHSIRRFETTGEFLDFFNLTRTKEKCD